MSALATEPPTPRPRGSERSRPSWTVGTAILVAGIVLGGGLGVVFQKTQRAGSSVVATQPAQKPVETATPPARYASVPFGSLVTSTPAVTAAPSLPPPPVTAPPPAAGSKQQKRAAASKVAGAARAPKAAPKPRDDGYTIASAGADEAKEPRSKPPPEPKRAPPAQKPEPRKSSAAGKPASGSDDADKVLKAAMGATENTL